MAVKVNDGNRTVSPVDRSQQGQSNGVITTQGNDAGQSLALLRRADLVRVGGWLARKDAVVALFDLV